MRLFSKKKKPQLEKVARLSTGKLDETLETAKELKHQSEAGVLRTDYWDIIIDILIELHPEIKTHPKMVQFMEKLQRYQQEREGGK